ncbi:PPR repeat protein [Phytophthora cinnamomi]|uniref:PPR repeat protein n=1 Tax=Phytophthora cinnamomi TaxID=4785 RepID=UPI0035598EB8|nr:PPR repeat protein [Phytophthora cinnamomi]
MMQRRVLLLPASCAPQTQSQLQLFVRWQSTTSPSSQDWRQFVADFQRKANDTNAPLQAKDVESVVRVCAQSDRTREALDAIRRGEKRGVTVPLRSHLQVSCSFARKGQADRALAMMPELRERFGDTFNAASTNRYSVYDPLMTVFKDQGDWRSTHAAIAQMHELGVTPTLRAFRVLMLTAAKARQKDTLLTTVQFVENKFPSVWTDGPTLTAICQALVEIGEHQRVMAIYHKLDGGWIQEHANTMLFNQFVLAAVRGGDVKNGKKRTNQKSTSGMQIAMDILERMQAARNAAPDDFTFATCMLELEKRGQWTRVLDLFNTMLDIQARSQNALDDKSTKPVINALSCSSMIRALHILHEANQPEQDESAGKNDAPNSPRKSKHDQRKLKQDLSVVLKQLRTVDLRNIGHASTLIDTLDEFKLFTAARQTFKRVLDEGIIQKTPWRLKDGFEIDLHTFSRGVAKCAVVSAFDEIMCSQQGISVVSLAGNAPLQDLRIITGVGRRSQTFMKPVLRHEITELLTKSSRPPLWPSSHPTNPGVLLVRHNALRKWLQKGGAIRYF